MGRNLRGTRDGSGPHKDSYRNRQGLKGRRQASGQKCPKK